MLMSKAAEKPSATRHDVFVERLAAVPEIARLDLGPLFRSTQAAELTESETEYVVQVKSSVENCSLFIYLKKIPVQFLTIL